MIRFCLLLFVSLTGLVASGSPQSARALFDQAETAFTERDFTLAVQLAEEARSLLGSTNPRIEGLLAQAYFETDQPAEARIALDRLFQLVPEPDQAGVRQHYQHLVERIDEALERAQEAATRAERELNQRLADRDTEKRQHPPDRDAAVFAARLEDLTDVSALLAFQRAFPESEEGKQAAEKARAIAQRQELALREQFADTLAFAKESFLERGTENPLFAVPSEHGYRFLPVGNADAGIPRFYEDARQFSHGLAATQLDGKWGFINRSGEVQIPHAYDAVLQPFNGFVAQAITDEEPVFVNAEGREVPGLNRYEQISFLPGGVAEARTPDGERWLTDWQGEPLFDESGYRCIDFVQLGNSWRYAIGDADDRIGVVDADGHVLVPFHYEAIVLGDFGGDPRPVRIRLDHKWGTVDPSTGELLVEPRFDALLPFQHGMAAFLENGRWGFIDTHGNTLIPAQFDRVPFGGAASYGGGQLALLPDGGTQMTQGSVLARVLRDDHLLLVDPSGSVHSHEELISGDYGQEAALAAHEAANLFHYLVPPIDEATNPISIVGTWDFIVERAFEEPRILRKLLLHEFAWLRDQIHAPVSVFHYTRGSLRFHPDGRFELAQRLSAQLTGGPHEGGEVQFIHRQSGSYSLINNRILPITVTSHVEAANPAAEEALRFAPELRKQLTSLVPFEAEALEIIANGEQVRTLTDPEPGTSITLHRRDELLSQP